MTNAFFLADPRAVARRVLMGGLVPPRPLDLTAWARHNIHFGEESPFPGPYDPAKFPFFTRILEVLSPQHPASVVVLKKSAQLGGTVLAQIVVGGILDLSPRPLFLVFPSDGNATKWKRNKFTAMVKASKTLSRIMQPENARQGNSAMYWARRDGRGYLQLAGANSPGQLSMESYPYAVHDDLAKWPADNGAGDPEGQADSRSKAFLAVGGKVFKIGTPLVQPGCRVTAGWQQGTRERYHVPCPTCGHEQPLEWDNMLACLDEAHPEDAHFTCVSCNSRIDQHHRTAMTLAGRWVAENPGADVVSFYLWAAYSPLEDWANIVRAWLKAKGKPEAEQVFLNDNVGLAYQTATEAPPWESLSDRAEADGLPRGIVPAGYYDVTIGIDCQGDRAEWQAVAWGPSLTRIVIDRGIIHHHISTASAWAELDQLVERTWQDWRGNRRPTTQTAIDGGMWKDDVHEWARRHKSAKVIVVKGAKVDTAPPLALIKTERRADGKIIRAQRRWYQVGVSGMKASLYALLKKGDPLEFGYVRFVAGLGDDYFQQLTSETRKPFRRRDGSATWRWVPTPGIAQEMLDTHLYAWAAAHRAGVVHRSDEQWEALRLKYDGAPGTSGPDLFSAALSRDPVPPAPDAVPAAPVARPAVAVPAAWSRHHTGESYL